VARTDESVIAELYQRLGELADEACRYNHPLVTGDGIHSSNAPGSREPGGTQCAWGVREVRRILKRTVDEVQWVVDASKPRQRSIEVVYRVGGIVVHEDEPR
jgi:hypothetical protein